MRGLGTPLPTPSHESHRNRNTLTTYYRLPVRPYAAIPFARSRRGQPATEPARHTAVPLPCTPGHPSSRRQPWSDSARHKLPRAA